MIEIIIVNKDDTLIASVKIGSKKDVPFVVDDIIEKNGYRVLINEEPKIKH